MSCTTARLSVVPCSSRGECGECLVQEVNKVELSVGGGPVVEGYVQAIQCGRGSDRVAQRRELSGIASLGECLGQGGAPAVLLLQAPRAQVGSVKDKARHRERTDGVQAVLLEDGVQGASQCGPVVLVGRAGAQGVRNLIALCIEGAEDSLLLAAEVAEECAAGDSGGGCQIAEGDVLETLLAEQVESHVGQLGPHSGPRDVSRTRTSCSVHPTILL